MNFTEAQKAWLRAALEGKTVQWRSIANEGVWHSATDFGKDATLLTMGKVEVRIKPDVIIVNGIEVPAPEKNELEEGAEYWLADVTEEKGFSGARYWVDRQQDLDWLRFGLVHRHKEAAAAHGIAMRAHKPG